MCLIFANHFARGGTLYYLEPRLSIVAKRAGGLADVYVDVHRAACAPRGFDVSFIQDAVNIPRLFGIFYYRWQRIALFDEISKYTILTHGLAIVLVNPSLWTVGSDHQ